MKYLILLFLLVSVSCSGAVPRIMPKKKGIDPIFKPYIESYKYLIPYNKYKHKFPKLNMNFADLEFGVLGRCYWLGADRTEIEISRKSWKWFSFVEKQFVIYHELEHCIRMRMHTDIREEIENIVDFIDEIGYRLGILSKVSDLSDGCPGSIMNSYIVEWFCRNKHYEHYLEEINQLE